MNILKNKKILIGVIIALLVLGVETVLAAYTGPVGRSSSVTYWERKNCHYQAVYNPPGPEYYSCTLDLYYAPSDACPGSVEPFFNPIACAGWPGDCTGLSCDINGTETIEDCNPGDEACTMREEGVDLDPATVSGTAGCTLTGNNGWCRSGATVALSASEPVSGERITWIEGNQGAGDFSLCDPADASSVTCSWPAGDGNRSLSFWAHSTFGDTSEMGSVNLKVDGTNPTAGLVIGATPNGAGWYNTNVPLTTSGTDATSGVAGRYVQVNGGAWQPSPYTLSVDGLYTVRGVVQDNAGNQTVTTNNTVNLDQTPPTFTVVPDRAPEYGDWYLGPVTVSVNGSDNLSGYTHSTYLLYDESGVPQTGTMPVTISAEGQNDLNLNVFDLAGNHNGGSYPFRIDIGAPTASTIINGTIGLNNWYISPVDLNVTGNDAGSGVCSVSLNLDNTGWVPAPLNGYAGQGNHSFTGQSQDCVGQLSAVTAAESFKVDTVYPTLNAAYPAPDGLGSWHITPFTVSVTGTDATSGIALVQVRSNGGAWQNNSLLLGTEGVNNLDFRSQDNAGNTATTSQQLYLDLTDPALNLSRTGTPGLAGWYISPVTVNANASDVISGIAALEMRQNGGAWQAVNSLNLSADGVYAIEARAGDNAGRETTVADTIPVDVTYPSLEATFPVPDGENGWYIAPFTVNVTGADATSGLALVQARYAGGLWQDNALLVDREGLVDVEFRSQDNAGNTTNTPEQFLVDLSNPTLTMSNTGTAGLAGWYISPVTVTAIGNDAVSGLQSIQMRSNSGAWAATNSLLLAADGIYTVDALAEDNAGRQNQAQESVNVDATAPTLTATYPVPDGLNNWYVNPIDISISGTDVTSGILLAQVRSNGGSWGSNLTLTDEGVNSLDFRVQDNAGNLSTANSQVSLDLTDPALTITTSGTLGTNGWYISAATATAVGTDAISGLMNVQIREGAAAWQVRDEVTVTADGMHPLEFMATDNAGRQTLVQREIKVDATAPTLAPTAAGTMGLNGWYTSMVTLKANAADATSGIASVMPAAEVTVSEDAHYTANWTARDNAGNEASAALAIKIDRTAPAVAFDPLNGFVVGSVTLTGHAADATSGLMKVEVSTNLGLSWTEVTVNPVDGSWSMPWDTLLLPGGQMLVLARATDQAGNVNTVNLSATIANRRPTIDLTERWYIWESGELRIDVGDVDYENVTVKICDYENRWPCVVYSYDTGEAPETVTWNRKFGDIIAPVGEYPVEASITDLLGRGDTANGVIVIPPPLPSATPTLTLTPTATPTTTGTPQPTPTRELTQMATPTATAIPAAIVPTPVEEAPQPAAVINYGPFLVLIGFCFALGASVSRDRRPREWKRLAEQLTKLIQISKLK